MGIGLCHSIKKGGVLANRRFVLGNAVDVGNGTALRRWNGTASWHANQRIVRVAGIADGHPFEGDA